MAGTSPSAASGLPKPKLRPVAGSSTLQSFGFPLQHVQLLVAAVHGVFSWSHSGLTELFRSGSRGIVAATKTRPDDDILAVADSNVIILHDIQKGMQRSYRLRDTGPPRILWYDRHNDRLLYTTTLQHAVQVYSLHEEALLEPASEHPSPPNVFAVAEQLCIMLSASAKPPTIYITTLDKARTKVLVHPPCTTSPVSAAAFHPQPNIATRSTCFVLGFLDGTLASYMYGQLQKHANRNTDRDEFYEYEELGHVERVHVAGTDAFSHEHLGFQGTDPATGAVTVGDVATAVTALALVPGYFCLTVSVGSDGRCCVTDFKDEAQVRRGWHIHGSASALAVREELIGIGSKTGKVLLYSLKGELIIIRDFGNTRIVDLEWIEPKQKAQGKLTGTSINKKPQRNRIIEVPATSPLLPKTSLPDVSSLATPTTQISDRSPTFLSGEALKPSPLAKRTIKRESISKVLPRTPIGQYQRRVGQVESDATIPLFETPTKPQHSIRPLGSATKIPARQVTRYANNAPTEQRGTGVKDPPVNGQMHSPGKSITDRPDDLRSPITKTKHLGIHRMQPPVIPPRPSPKKGGKWEARKAQGISKGAITGSTIDPSIGAVSKPSTESVSSPSPYETDAMDHSSNEGAVLGIDSSPRSQIFPQSKQAESVTVSRDMTASGMPQKFRLEATKNDQSVLEPLSINSSETSEENATDWHQPQKYTEPNLADRKIPNLPQNEIDNGEISSQRPDSHGEAIQHQGERQSLSPLPGTPISISMQDIRMRPSMQVSVPQSKAGTLQERSGSGPMLVSVAAEASHVPLASESTSSSECFTSQSSSYSSEVACVVQQDHGAAVPLGAPIRVSLPQRQKEADRELLVRTNRQRKDCSVELDLRTPIPSPPQPTGEPPAPESMRHAAQRVEAQDSGCAQTVKPSTVTLKSPSHLEESQSKLWYRTSSALPTHTCAPAATCPQLAEEIARRVRDVLMCEFTIFKREIDEKFEQQERLIGQNGMGRTNE